MWFDLSLLLLTLIIILLGIGDYGLYEPHEGHFAMVGKEMVLRGNWITPHLNGAPYLNKPPLLYWLIAISTRLFGTTEFAARLPIGLAGWLGIIIAWRWTRQLWGINTSRLTALMLSVTLGWFVFTHQILIDVLLGTLLLASYYCLWRSLYATRSWIYSYGFYLLLGLCLLTKGFIGIVFPLCSCFILVILRRDWKLKRLHLLPGLLIVLAVILPWFLAVEKNNPGFSRYFIVNEHLDRLLDRRFPPDYEVSKVSIGGYLAVTALWCFPWILFFPSVVRSTWQEWRRGWQKKALSWERKHSDGILLIALAAILPVVAFLPLSSRLVYYSVPAIPPYIMLCGRWWNKSYLEQTTLRTNFKISIAAIEVFRHSLFRRQVIRKRSAFLRFLRINTPRSNTSRFIYGWIAVLISLSFIVAIAFLPQIDTTLKIDNLLLVVTVALAIGWLGLGIAIINNYRWAWLPLFLSLIIVYTAVVKGFVIYQDVRSSKTLVRQADACLNVNTLWIFEGSREIGAAGGISYYLNQNKNYSRKNLFDAGISLPAGWQTVNGDRLYRTVKILSNGGKNRLPPSFPGSLPAYLITKPQLQTYWNSARPVVFVTDFLRQPNDASDPLEKNLPQNSGDPLLTVNSRTLYGNVAARESWCLRKEVTKQDSIDFTSFKERSMI